MQSVTTRTARTKDIDTIVELWKEMMDFHFERDRHFARSSTGHEAFAKFVAEHIEKEESLVLVAEEGDAIVAYCIATISNRPPVFETTRYGAIYDLLVTRSRRRQGIGKRLVHEIERWFSQQGIHRIEARVSTRNEVSTQFWRKIGYEPYTETVFREI